MSKYIIELDDRIKLVTSVGVTENGVVYTTSDYVHNLEELNSDYINEHYGSLQDTAYQRGLDDAWEAARNISMLKSDGGYSWKEMKSIFGMDSPSEIYVHHTAAEAINKIKAYEEKQNDKIEVGDEVEPFYTAITGVVTLIDGDTIYILWRDGSSTSTVKLKEVTKTGRHFDIASILEDMRNENYNG